MSPNRRLVAIFSAAFFTTVAAQACNRSDCPHSGPPRVGRYLVVDASAPELVGGRLAVVADGPDGHRRLTLSWDDPSGQQSTATWVW